MSKFNIESIRDIASSRQLCLIGRVTRIDPKRMPQNMICCWLISPRPVGLILTTIRYTYLDALCKIRAILEDDMCGKTQDWFPLAQDLKEWENTHKKTTQRDKSLRTQVDL